MRTTKKKDTQVRVAPYLRASRDRYGTEKSVGDQEIDYKQSLVGSPEWTEVAFFRDNNRSASRFATKTREDFVKLVEAIDARRDRPTVDLGILPVAAPAEGVRGPGRVVPGAGRQVVRVHRWPGVRSGQCLGPAL